MNEDGKISESRGSITSFEGAETLVNMSNVATLLHELDKRVVVWRDFVMLRRHLANHVGRVKNVHNVGSKQEEIKVLPLHCQYQSDPTVYAHFELHQTCSMGGGRLARQRYYIKTNKKTKRLYINMTNNICIYI